MYKLEKYTGKQSRFICPQCGGKFSLSRYVNERGEYLADAVGRCNRESKCGYHYTPKQYYQDNPNLKIDFKPFLSPKKVQTNKSINNIPIAYLDKSMSPKSAFVEYLYNTFDKNMVNTIVKDYHLGATKTNDVIFWQKDINGKIRTGKIQRYNRTTGKRLKNGYHCGIKWVHSELKKQNKLPKNWELSQCLFGEHLLPLYPNRMVVIVESEKNAILGAIFAPNYIWLATGTKHGFTSEKLQILKNRDVIVYPDTDSLEEWREKAKQLTFCKSLIVSTKLNEVATSKEINEGYDIADYIIKQQQNKKTL